MLKGIGASQSGQRLGEAGGGVGVGSVLMGTVCVSVCGEIWWCMVASARVLCMGARMRRAEKGCLLTLLGLEMRGMLPAANYASSLRAPMPTPRANKTRLRHKGAALRLKLLELEQTVIEFVRTSPSRSRSSGPRSR